MLDAKRIDELQHGGNKTMTWLNAAHLLVPFVEVDTWMRTYNVSVM